MANYKLDIFDLLSKISSSKSGDIYASLSEDGRKGFAPLVVMRWLSGTSDEQQIMLLNEFANPVIFPLAKHPHLLMRVLQAANSKTGRRYQWLGVKSKKKNVETMKVISEFYGMSMREVRLMNPLPTENEVVEMAESLGYQKDELTKLKKEFKE